MPVPVSADVAVRPPVRDRQDLGNGRNVAIDSTYNSGRYLLLKTEPASVVDMHNSEPAAAGTKRLREFDLHEGFLGTVTKD